MGTRSTYSACNRSAGSTDLMTDTKYLCNELRDCPEVIKGALGVSYTHDAPHEIDGAELARVVVACRWSKLTQSRWVEQSMCSPF